MPNGPVDLHFAPQNGRHVRLAASLLRAHFRIRRHALQLAEWEVFGPASRFVVESSADLWEGFAEDPSAFVRINPRRRPSPSTPRGSFSACGAIRHRHSGDCGAGPSTIVIDYE